MSIETQEQALAEARKRWGFSAHVVYYDSVEEYEVTSNPYKRHPQHWGIGDSWDAAFADAEKREGK